VLPLHENAIRSVRRQGAKVRDVQASGLQTLLLKGKQKVNHESLNERPLIR